MSLVYIINCVVYFFNQLLNGYLCKSITNKLNTYSSISFSSKINYLQKKINEKKNKPFELWKNNIKNVNNEIYTDFYKLKYKLSLIEITKKNTYCNWVYENNIINLKNSNVAIINMNCLYDYSNNKYINEEYLINLSKFCHLHKIILVLLTELHPNKINDIKYLNRNNIISPYSYKSRLLGGVQKLPNNQYSTKAPIVSIDKILIDVMNIYGVDNNNLIYISNKKVNNINTFLL